LEYPVVFTWDFSIYAKNICTVVVNMLKLESQADTKEYMERILVI